MRLFLRAKICKNRKSRIVPLNSVARQTIERLIRFNRARGFSTEPKAPLLMTKRHRRLTARAVQYILADLRKRAGLAVPLTPHSMRRYAEYRIMPSSKVRCSVGPTQRTCCRLTSGRTSCGCCRMPSLHGVDLPPLVAAAMRMHVEVEEVDAVAAAMDSGLARVQTQAQGQKGMRRSLSTLTASLRPAWFSSNRRSVSGAPHRATGDLER